MSHRQEKDFKSTNVKFCAFLMLNEIKPVKVNKLGRGRGEFLYILEEETWDTMKLNFTNSEFIKYAHCMESIKDLCY